MSVPALVDLSGVAIPPEAFRRARLRAMLAEGRYGGGTPFAYDSAEIGSQEMGEWFPGLRSPDHEINRDRNRMVARSRDLVRNDGWGTGATNRIVDNAVGAQFRLSANPDFLALRTFDKAFDATWADEFSQTVEAGWRLYADDPARYCDVTRTQTMVQMFHLALTHKVIDGEGLAVLLYLPELVGEYGARSATTVQIVDPDRLSNPYEGQDTDRLRGGVELNTRGAALAYHIRRGYSTDWYEAADSMIWDRVPRETAWGRPVVVHDFDRERAGQHRGLSVLNPVLARLKMLTRYDGAELQQAILQTVFGTFITSPFDQGQVSNALQDPDDPEISAYQALRADFHRAKGLTLGGVRLPTMAPGEDIKTVSATRPGGHFSDFEHAMLRNVAAALGLSSAQVSQDWSRTNYSSARAEMLDAWKTLARRRADFGIGFASPIYGAWLEEEFDKGRLPLPARAPSFASGRAAYQRCKWIGPGRGWIDPVKERQGEVLGLDAGFSTLEQACAEMNGSDWREQLAQRAVEVETFKRLKLKLPEWGAAEVPASQDFGSAAAGVTAPRFPHLAQRVFNVPLALHPGKAEVIIAALADRLGIARLFGEAGRPVALAPMIMDDEPEPARGYEVLGGVAIIPVEGTLVAKLGCLCPYSGMTGYDGIRVNFLTALADASVRAIVFDIDSPGGECAGLFDLVDTIVAGRGVKPIRAILTEVAFSAAYAIASAADRISVPRTGGVGSIGVLCMHVDWSRALSEAGATVTLIRHGERKFEGNSYEPLSRSARASMQSDVDATGALFVATVARNRGLPVAAVAGTEAATFLGAEGVALGLADAVEAPDEALRVVFADLEI